MKVREHPRFGRTLAALCDEYDVMVSDPDNAPINLVESDVIASDPDNAPLNLVKPCDSCSYEVSFAASSRLKEITLSELYVGHRRMGKRLVLRTARFNQNEGEIDKNVPYIVVEDLQGTGALFTMNNVGDPWNPHVYIEDLLLYATVFFIKEPFCTQSERIDCIVICTSPSDVVVIKEANPYFKELQPKWQTSRVPSWLMECDVRSAKSLLKAGRLYHTASKYSIAIRLYLLAEHLGLDADEALDARVNLADAYFHSKYYEEAKKYAMLAIEAPGPTNERALTLAALSNYSLALDKEARKYFKSLSKIFPNDKSIEKKLETARKRVSEVETGSHDMSRFFEARRKNKIFNCADYVGPLRMPPPPINGRGVFTTEDVAPGTLLLVSRALDFWTDDGSDNDIKVWRKFVASLMRNIWKYPETLGQKIYKMNHGVLQPDEERTELTEVDENVKQPIVNVKRLINIVMTNMAGVKLSGRLFKEDEVRSYGFKKCCGLFHSLSKINHSCLPNASVNLIGNVVFIRATKPIEKDTEVLISFISWEVDYPSRLEFFSNNNIVCNCLLCESNKSLSNTNLFSRDRCYAERDRLYRLAEKLAIVKPKQVLGQMEELYSEFRSTCPELNQFPHQMEVALIHECKATILASLHGELLRSYHLKQYDERLQLLNSFGFDEKLLFDSQKNKVSLIPSNSHLDERLLYNISRIIYIKNQLDEPEEVRVWVEILKSLERTYSGDGDVKEMQEKYVAIADLIVN